MNSDKAVDHPRQLAGPIVETCDASAKAENSPAPAVPWWLFLNLVALDAPIVAVVWQRFLADEFSVVVPWAASAALGMVVWTIYLADRLLDARCGDCSSDRHRTAAAYPRHFVALIVLAMCLTTASVAQLPAEYLAAGASVGFAVVAYLILVHAVGDRLRAVPGSKELLVAIGFAAGVAVPLGVSGTRPAEWLPAVASFGGACWLNCRLIDQWESVRPGRFLLEWTLGVSMMIVAAVLPLAVAFAVGATVLALIVVHLACRCRPRLARALADACMLTPILWWVLT